MARPKKPEKPPNHERWLVSYADFITLLFAFFVVMFSTASEQDPGKQKRVEDAFRASVGLMSLFRTGGGQEPILTPSTGTGADITIMIQPNAAGLAPIRAPGNIDTEEPGDYEARAPEEPDLESPQNPEDEPVAGAWPTPVPTPIPIPSSTPVPLAEAPGNGEGQGGETIQTIYDDLRNALTEELNQGMVEIRQERRGIVLSLKEAGFFDSGSAALKSRSVLTVDRIARKLASLRRQVVVRVEGHTDNVPVGHYSHYQDNRELSSARANTVIRIFERLRFPERSLIAAGCGEWRPVAPNDTRDGRARNRRVDIIVLNDEYAALEASSELQN